MVNSKLQIYLTDFGNRDFVGANAKCRAFCGGRKSNPARVYQFRLNHALALRKCLQRPYGNVLQRGFAAHPAIVYTPLMAMMDLRDSTLGLATQAAEGMLRRRFTVAELEAMVAAGILSDDERIELIGGDVVPMSRRAIATRS
jgi:hypothetical protein